MEAAEPATVIASQMDWTEEVPEPEERTLTVLSLYNGTVPSCETGLHAVEAPHCVMEVLETSGWFELEMEPPTLGEVEELFRELGEEMEPLDQRNRSLQLGCRIGQSLREHLVSEARPETENVRVVVSFAKVENFVRCYRQSGERQLNFLQKNFDALIMCEEGTLLKERSDLREPQWGTRSKLADLLDVCCRCSTFTNLVMWPPPFLHRMIETNALQQPAMSSFLLDSCCMDVANDSSESLWTLACAGAARLSSLKPEDYAYAGLLESGVVMKNSISKGAFHPIWANHNGFRYLSRDGPIDENDERSIANLEDCLGRCIRFEPCDDGLETSALCCAVLGKKGTCKSGQCILKKKGGTVSIMAEKCRSHRFVSTVNKAFQEATPQCNWSDLSGISLFYEVFKKKGSPAKGHWKDDWKVNDVHLHPFGCAIDFDDVNAVHLVHQITNGVASFIAKRKL